MLINVNDTRLTVVVSGDTASRLTGLRFIQLAKHEYGKKMTLSKTVNAVVSAAVKQQCCKLHGRDNKRMTPIITNEPTEYSVNVKYIVIE